MLQEHLRLGVCAGEPSGDLLGGAVIRSLMTQFGGMSITGIGGEYMRAAGLNSLYPMDRLSVMGFIEPLKRLPDILQIRRNLIDQQKINKSHLFLGIDSPDFNLGVEANLRLAGLRTAHLVSPSIWAWRRDRIKTIRKSVDKMLCLLPFEVDLYRKAGIEAVCVGHPLVDDLKKMPSATSLRKQMLLPIENTILSVLPGSRHSEVSLLMPVFTQTMRQLQQWRPSMHFIIPAATPALREIIESCLGKEELNKHVVDGSGREAICASNATLLASGTASLEAMLLRTPMVIAYRMATVSWMALSRLVKTEFVGLPNILAGRSVVPEFLQGEATSERLATAIIKLLEHECPHQTEEFSLLAEQIGGNFAQRCTDALSPLIEF